MGKAQSKPKAKVNAKSKGQSNPKVKMGKSKTQVKREPKGTVIEDDIMEPGTSGLNKKGGPIDLTTPEASESDSDISDEEGACCCVYDRFQPEGFVACDEVVLLKWAQCDLCPHWVHLRFCYETRLIKRGDVFKCPKCLHKN